MDNDAAHAISTVNSMNRRSIGTDNTLLSIDRNVVAIDGFEDVPENDEAALKQAVAMQPVSVAICASGGLQFYSSGIVGGKCCDELDHGVLAVGYGVVRLVSDSGFPSFILA